MVVEHKKIGAAGMFYVDVEGKTLAKMTYTMPSENQMTIVHTEVDPSLAGKSVGLQLVHAAVEYAREHFIKIIPQCPFAKSVFDKKPEFRDVLA